MKKSILTTIVAVALVLTTAALNAQKPVIAVLNFETVNVTYSM